MIMFYNFYKKSYKSTPKLQVNGVKEKSKLVSNAKINHEHNKGDWKESKNKTWNDVGW